MRYTLVTLYATLLFNNNYCSKHYYLDLCVKEKWDVHLSKLLKHISKAVLKTDRILVG